MSLPLSALPLNHVSSPPLGVLGRPSNIEQSPQPQEGGFTVLLAQTPPPGLYLF